MTELRSSSAASAEEVTPRFRQAFERLSEQIRAVPEEGLVPINIDIPTAVAIALGVLPRLRASRERLLTLADFDLQRFDHLEDYALALGHAHGAYMSAFLPPRSLEELGIEGTTVRDVLLSDAAALVKRGLVEGARLSEIGKRTGYRNIAFDLLATVSVFRERWPAIHSKTAVSLGELEQAEVLADRLITTVGERDQAPVGLPAVAADRQRIFTLFVNAYDEVRRAFTYLRWYEGDVDEFAPSLYAGKRRRRDGAEADTEKDADDAHSSDVRPTTPGPAPAPGPGSHPATIPAAAAPAAPGLPGGSPFSN